MVIFRVVFLSAFCSPHFFPSGGFCNLNILLFFPKESHGSFLSSQALCPEIGPKAGRIHISRFSCRRCVRDHDVHQGRMARAGHTGPRPAAGERTKPAPVSHLQNFVSKTFCRFHFVSVLWFFLLSEIRINSRICAVSPRHFLIQIS